MQRSRVGTPADNGRLWRSGNDDPNRLHRDDLSWLHFATLSEGAQAVRSSVDGGRPAPIAEYALTLHGDHDGLNNTVKSIMARRSPPGR